MVLFKRKPVNYLPHPNIQDQDAEIWLISESQEIFLDYESYLHRLDFLKSRKFTCEVTGRSGLTYFDALRSEQAGSKEVDEAFPDALREPVLRRVQFSTTSRIDNLVDEVFDEFKTDFYPGEIVTVVLNEGNRLSGKVRDKAKFAEMKDPDGTVTRKAFARYFVSLIDERFGEEALVDDSHIVRDRKVFTKQMLRSFIKNTVTREAWTGAPWLVKPRLADEYRIDTNVPPHLQYGNKIAEKKAQKKIDQDGMFGIWQPHKLPELKPAPKGRKAQYSPDQLYAMQQGNYEEYQRALQADPAFAADSWGHSLPPGNLFPNPDRWNKWAQPDGPSHPNQQQIVPKHAPKLSPPPPIKYPIEDLDVDPLHDGTHRPIIKFMTEKKGVKHTSKKHTVAGLEEHTVGLLLETWNTLNVYCQVLTIDSFTFDDFVDAMQFSSDEVDCELFVEIHCAILKKLVNSENEQNGALQISLPDFPDPDEDEEDESDQEDSHEPTPTPEPEVPAKRTRSSLNKVHFAEEKPIEPKSENGEINIHRAGEMFGEYGWIQRLRKRDFKNGGWELVMVGLLHQLAERPRYKERCNQILVHLAPLDADPSIRTASLQYSTMDINLRALALQIISQLFLETKAVKTFLEDMSNLMTQYRKAKIEHQRTRKEAFARLKNLQIERRVLAPEPEKSPSPVPELEDANDVEKTEDGATSIADSEDEEPINARTLRRGQDRAAERKRKREEERERKERAAEAKQNKGSREYQRVLKQIDKERDKIDEAYEQILSVDSDLREVDCPRTRCLGKDRFCNRYWWFERNAMPHGGVPDSSTANAEYANGRLWVQGPDQMEREGFIDVPESESAAYYRRFQMTPAERRKLEEGSTNLNSANEWGFYDQPEEVDMLIGWLDSRGVRELKLKKEVSLQREVIMKHMEKRTAYLTPRQQSEEPMTRMSTRTKTYLSENADRCLKWKNQTAIDVQGHKHIDPPPKPKGRNRKAVEETTGTTTRGSAQTGALNRQGKPTTRQGTRYQF